MIAEPAHEEAAHCGKVFPRLPASFALLTSRSRPTRVAAAGALLRFRLVTVRRRPSNSCGLAISKPRSLRCRGHLDEREAARADGGLVADSFTESTVPMVAKSVWSSVSQCERIVSDEILMQSLEKVGSSSLKLLGACRDLELTQADQPRRDQRDPDTIAGRSAFVRVRGRG